MRATTGSAQVPVYRIFERRDLADRVLERFLGEVKPPRPRPGSRSRPATADAFRQRRGDAHRSDSAFRPRGPTSPRIPTRAAEPSIHEVFGMRDAVAMLRLAVMRSKLKPLLNTSRKSSDARRGSACRLRMPNSLATPGSILAESAILGFESEPSGKRRDVEPIRDLPAQATGPSSSAEPPLTPSFQPTREKNFPIVVHFPDAPTRRCATPRRPPTSR